jgi:hypothetical protein
MRPEQLERIQDLIMQKSRRDTNGNENTGIYAYHTYSDADAQSCLDCLTKGVQEGFKIYENKIYFSGTYDPASKLYLEACRTFVYNSGISDKIPFQTSQVYGTAPYLAYMSQALYNGDLSNRHTSVTNWHIFIIILRPPLTDTELAMFGDHHMALKTAFRGKANGLCTTMICGGDGEQECIYVFDCLVVHCHNIHIPSLLPERSTVERNPGAGASETGFL